MPDVNAYVAALSRKLATGDATEHTHRAALESLLEAFPGITAVNEPKRVAAGAPDYNVGVTRGHGLLSIGKVEAKDIGANLDAIVKDSGKVKPTTREGKQLARYRAAFPNLILTDYVTFVWFRNGEALQKKALGDVDGVKIAATDEGKQAVESLLTDFLADKPHKIRTARTLAERMARLTDLMREIVSESIANKSATTVTLSLKDTFKEVLVSDLTDAAFADMFCQTIAYGLFAARVNHGADGSTFDRKSAAAAIPKTNPFLRRFFTLITGPDLDDEPYVSLVDDLAQLLSDTEMDRVLKDFGSQRRDPIVHFYETFLAAYDPRLRDIRGVYYTPLPVVEYIINSVDEILKTTFGLNDGLADTTKENGQHKVLVLDPACGTGTFLYVVIDLVRKRFKAAGMAGAWSSYVRDHLLPRLFGFEVMIAPYAVAHLKLGLELAALDVDVADRTAFGYDFAADERIGVYLTNSLDPGHTQAPMPLTEFISDEANAAQDVKQTRPIMVVVGNPPYQGQSLNASERLVPAKSKSGKILRDKNGKTRMTKEKTWIGNLLGRYYKIDGQALGERNPKWLQDDYVKFIRMGQDRIDRTGQGVLAFITNHTFLDAPTFRGMRESLLESFDDIYVVDLHGSIRRKERQPAGKANDNVFDQIQQGVCVVIFVKSGKAPGHATLHHADAWGTRADKYEWLQGNTVKSTTWDDFVPSLPFYTFRPQDDALKAEWDSGTSLMDIFGTKSTGLVTYRDDLVIATTEQGLKAKIERFCDPAVSDQVVRTQFFGTKTRTTAKDEVYLPGDNRDWKMSERRKKIQADKNREKSYQRVTFRPFDDRHIFYHEDAIESRRYDVMRHMLEGNNLALIAARSNKSSLQDQFFITHLMSEVKAGERSTGSTHFPLWLLTGSAEGETMDMLSIDAPSGRQANLSQTFLDLIQTRLGLTLTAEDHGDFIKNIGPVDILDYIYAVVSSRTYRSRYETFLREDYARIPVTSDLGKAKALAAHGARLRELHLLTASDLDNGRPTYPVAGTNEVTISGGLWVAAGGTEPFPATGGISPGTVSTDRVYINDVPGAAQYFDGVSADVWQFTVGGYEVLSRWLQARQGQALAFDDIALFRTIANAIRLTLETMAEIETTLSAWPLS